MTGPAHTRRYFTTLSVDSATDLVTSHQADGAGQCCECRQDWPCEPYRDGRAVLQTHGIKKPVGEL